eukprot:gene14656-19691_t
MSLLALFGFSNEDVKPPAPISKYDLHQLILEKNKQIEVALQMKDYKLCSELNVELEKLNSKFKAMPTAAQLAEKIFNLEVDLKKYIANKQYIKCVPIENEISVLLPQYEQLLLEEKLCRENNQSETATNRTNDSKGNGVEKNSKVKEGSVKGSVGVNQSIQNIQKKSAYNLNSRPVSKLRPRAPVTALDCSTIKEVAVKMNLNRVDAALLLDSNGALSGIITDNDITRRVLADKSIDPATCLVSLVMTKNPKCTLHDDSALDALELMVANRFRHLPVVDENGNIVGLLDIAKCLTDAIITLEKVQQTSNDNLAGEMSAKAENGVMIAEVMSSAIKSVASKRRNSKREIQAMEQLMQEIFGDSVPTLFTIIGEDEVPFVVPNCTIREAAKVMANVRKGVLIMDEVNGKLLGIVTPRDLLNRVVAKGLSPDETLISSIMTPSPDCVSPDLTLLDALKEMHDHKYLHLPVRDDTGRVLGLVDVMELVCSTAGGEHENGSKGWRDFFQSSMAIERYDDMLKTDETYMDRDSIAEASLSLPPKPKQIKPKTVKKLRPRTPVTAQESDSIFEVAMKMAANRVDAALIVNESNNVVGIVTDLDLIRRVVSQHLDPNDIQVSIIMTNNPICVSKNDLALDAVELMVINCFRHLPVVDQSGAAVGILDISKCIYDVMAVLENIHGVDNTEVEVDNSRRASKSASTGIAFTEVVTAALQTVAIDKEDSEKHLKAVKEIMEKMFDGSVPTLRSIIGDTKIPFITPSKTVFEAAEIMSTLRHGVLIMENSNGNVLGILTPKDVLDRVISKRLSPEKTLVSDVMTPNPDCVPPDYTLLEALQEMTDHKYLHLPVQEPNGKVIGLLDIVHLICNNSVGNSKGWREFFSEGIEINDDESDIGSFHNGQSMVSRSSKSNGGGLGDSRLLASQSSSFYNKATTDPIHRPVSKLRPKIPVIVYDFTNIFEVVQKMSEKRVDAALLLDRKGQLSGILTDNDVCRRIIANNVSVESKVADFMTKSPKCVRNDDSALDALEMMVENRFRHLPVLDKIGTVIGLLDITKCLYDAITVLERVQEDDETNSEELAMAEVINTALTSAASEGKRRNSHQINAMKQLVESIFGGYVPTLRSIVRDDEFVSVESTTSIRVASRLMAKIRKGVLVMDNLKVIGILTPKDLMTKVIAKGLSPDSTIVAEVMTPNPDTVDADLTLLDALKEMHDHKYLHLPVKEKSGRVIGLVDVIELVCSTAGGDGKSGGKGWRDFFGGAMAAASNSIEENSEINGNGKANSLDKSSPIKLTTQDVRPVSKLRANIPITENDICSIIDVAKRMAEKRMDAALLLDRKGRLTGIITDNDITRRVISQFVNVVDTQVSEVMTKNPKCVCDEDPALDALEMMVDNRFRHLPVLDKEGIVVGLLDIAKCLYDAISVLEVMQQQGSGEQSTSRNTPGTVLSEVMAAAIKTVGGSRRNNSAQIQAMKQMMEQ